MPQKPRFIYALLDPRDANARYVGATTNPVRRLYEHRSTRVKDIADWVIELSAMGLQPSLLILEECPAESFAERETYWIEEWRRRGAPLLNDMAGGAGPASLEAGRWSRDHESCIECETTELRHAAGGRCVRCWNRHHHRATQQPDRPYYAWSWDYPACIECGTTERPHKGHGMCENCLARHKRRQRPAQAQRWARDHDRCIVCGTTERPHKSRGQCKNCYALARYHSSRSA